MRECSSTLYVGINSVVTEHRTKVHVGEVADFYLGTIISEKEGLSRKKMLQRKVDKIHKV